MRLAKFPILLLVGVSAIGGPARATLPPPQIYYTVQAGVDCMYSANKAGVSRTRFESSEVWVPSANGEGFQHSELPISISFPTDKDGVARTCEVRSSLASSAEQSALTKVLNKTLGKPFEQSNSSIWMIRSKDGTRGLQFYPDNDSDEPKVRLIGAAF